jgi:phospholipid/cholesterol/gamma-HCH transport system ATP-binding protein
MSESVLTFDSVCFETASDHFASVRGCSFSLAPSDIMLLRIDEDNEHAPLLDMATGLLPPKSGSILFKGTSWTEMGPFEEACNRGEIGCVFETAGWVSSLSIADNIYLRERHHSSRPDSEIHAEADGLAAMIGLEIIPGLRPDSVRRRQLRKYEWIRACMGPPALLLLSFPERESASYALEHLLDLVERAAASGAAVLWMTDDNTVLDHERLRSAMKCAIEKEQWISLQGRDHHET